MLYISINVFIYLYFCIAHKHFFSTFSSMFTENSYVNTVVNYEKFLMDKVRTYETHPPQKCQKERYEGLEYSVLKSLCISVEKEGDFTE